LRVPRKPWEKEGQNKQHQTDTDDYDDGHQDSLWSAQLPLLLSGFLVVAGGRATLPLDPLLLLFHLLSMFLGLLGVLFGERLVLGSLAPMPID
jgi:hypothetical protein